MSEGETREQIENIINNNEETVKEEPINEEIKEEIKEEEIKAKPKSKSRAKPNIKITKQPVVESVGPIVEEPVVEEKPKKIYKLKEIVKCPDCMMDMTVHTLKYIHKRRGFCKADIKAAPEKPVPAPEQPVPEPVASVSYASQKLKTTEDIVNQYIKENPEIVSTYLRNERVLKSQRKQMHVRSLLTNAF